MGNSGQVVVGEEGPVVEQGLRPFSHSIDREKLVVLSIGVGLGVGEPAQYPELHRSGISAVDG
ncbi:MAG: hypothetical protein DRI39_06305 [Chloroflexi bacterium]|nr:MAG: hypothetical protein DRI39_06305 [Chloroflexota bacterium]